MAYTSSGTQVQLNLLVTEHRKLVYCNCIKQFSPSALKMKSLIYIIPNGPISTLVSKAKVLRKKARIVLEVV